MKKKVCMIVPSFSAKGGITSVVSGYRDSQLEKDYDVKYIETYCDGGKIAKAMVIMKAYIRFLYIILFWRPSIIHVHSSFGGSFYRKMLFIYISFWFRTPIVNHIHGADFREFYLEASDKKKNRIKKVYNKCSCLIALSDEWKLNLSHIVDENQIEVVENYSILNAQAIEERKTKKNGYNVLFLGFICKRKGCYDIPLIAEKVIRSIPDTKFVLAGTGDIDGIKELTPMSIKEHIVYPGWVRGGDKDRLLREADIFFLPSYNEGMPMSILDAMGYGLPIISTTVGGIPKIVHQGENGYICEPGDIVGLTNGIVRLLTNEEERNIAGEISVEIVRNGYSINQNITKLERIYSRIVK